MPENWREDWGPELLCAPKPEGASLRGRVGRSSEGPAALRRWPGARAEARRGFATGNGLRYGRCVGAVATGRSPPAVAGRSGGMRKA